MTSTFSRLSRRSKLLVGAPVAVALIAAAVIPGASALTQTATTASTAATAAGTSTSDDSFYTPPSPLPSGKPGDIVRSRPALAGPTGAQALANAWQVMYLSTNALGKPDVVTGIILVPKSGTPATMPIVGFAPGTSGLSFNCAPSKFIDQGSFYEQDAINGMLKKGWAVAVTDYEGYHVNPTATYTTGQSMGPAVIDSVRAAQRLSATGLSASASVIFRGYSQGGGGAMWAGQMAPTYAPELQTVGVVGGGVPADLVATSLILQSNIGFGFLLSALVGFDNAYGLNLASYETAKGKEVLAKLQSGDCTVQLITEYGNLQMTGPNGLFNPSPALQPGFKQAYADNKLGGTAIKVPTFHYHGTNDQIVAFGQDFALHQTYCSLGVAETWKTYPVDHITGVAAGNADALAWMTTRFAGGAITNNCASTTASPTPAPVAN